MKGEWKRARDGGGGGGGERGRKRGNEGVGERGSDAPSGTGGPAPTGASRVDLRPGPHSLRWMGRAGAICGVGCIWKSGRERMSA